MATREHRRGANLDAVADRVLDLGSPVYGDERERRVVLEACSFGFTLGLYAALAAAVLAGAAGSVGASLGFLLVAVAPSAAAAWYARRRNVDFDLLATRDRRAYVRGQVVALVAALAWCGTLAFLGLTGRPLLPVGDVLAAGASMGGALQGMAVGGVVGAVIGGAWHVASTRRKAARASRTADEPDDDF